MTIALSLTSGGHAAAPACFIDAPTSSVAANARTSAEYFCIIYPNATQTWSGKSLLTGSGFSDAGAAVWSVGTAMATYRVCRYTQAAGAVTENSDHPLNYATVGGNLINQSFLVVAGPKSCPSDVAANPAAGDLVNSNTLQHQP